LNINTIENGLAESPKKEFKSQDLTLCLKKIGVLQQGDVLKSYKDITAWQRGGAETYIAVASLTTLTKEIKFIAKALVSIATQPNQQLINWNS
jgi:hypothetical protein